MQTPEQQFGTPSFDVDDDGDVVVVPEERDQSSKDRALNNLELRGDHPWFENTGGKAKEETDTKSDDETPYEIKPINYKGHTNLVAIDNKTGKIVASVPIGENGGTSAAFVLLASMLEELDR